jgi:hypothetical protein
VMIAARATSTAICVAARTNMRSPHLAWWLARTQWRNVSATIWKRQVCPTIGRRFLRQLWLFRPPEVSFSGVVATEPQRKGVPVDFLARAHARARAYCAAGPRW